MNKEKIERLRELLANGSPRPWKRGSGYEQSVRGNYIQDAKGIIVCAEQDGTDTVLRDEDAELMCEAVNELPELFEMADELERFRAGAEKIKAMHDVSEEVEKLRAVARNFSDCPTDSATIREARKDLGK